MQVGDIGSISTCSPDNVSSRPSHENESTFIFHSSCASSCHRHVITNNKLPGGGAGSKTSNGMRMRYWYRFVITASVKVVVVTMYYHLNHPTPYHPLSSIRCCHFGSRQQPRHQIIKWDRSHCLLSPANCDRFLHVVTSDTGLTIRCTAHLFLPRRTSVLWPKSIDLWFA